MIGEKSKAYTLFTILNPINNTSNKKDALKYEKEAYVMTADVSYLAPYTGRGGWSWYTGSSGWMYQGLVKYFLGIRKEADHLIIEPSTPKEFGDYTVEYIYGAATYTIEVKKRNESDMTSCQLTVDGGGIDGITLKLIDDGKNHQICLIQ